MHVCVSCLNMAVYYRPWKCEGGWLETRLKAEISSPQKHHRIQLLWHGSRTAHRPSSLTEAVEWWDITSCCIRVCKEGKIKRFNTKNARGSGIKQCRATPSKSGPSVQEKTKRKRRQRSISYCFTLLGKCTWTQKPEHHKLSDKHSKWIRETELMH